MVLFLHLPISQKLWNIELNNKKTQQAIIALKIILTHQIWTKTLNMTIDSPLCENPLYGL